MNDKKAKKPSALQELLSYAGGRKWLVAAALALSAVSSVMGIMPFVCIWRIMREVLAAQAEGRAVQGLEQLGWQAVAWALGAMAVYFVGLMCSHLTAFRVAGNIRKACMRHVAMLPLGVVEQLGTGRVRRTVNEAAGSTENLLAHQLPDMAGSLATPVVMVVLLFVFDWRFGLASLVPFALGFVFMFRMAGPGMAEDMRRYQNALDAMNNEAVEYIRGIPVVKTFQQTVFSFKRFKKTIDDYEHFCINYTKACRWPMIAYTVAINSAFAFFIALGLRLFAAGGNAGDILLSLLFYIILSPITVTALNKVMFVSENLMLANDAVKRIHTLLDKEPLPEPAAPKAPADGTVSFKNVSFRYPGAQNDAVHDVSLTVRPGELAALVGPSGGGKTTLAALVSRFWDVSAGSVSIGGVDVREIGRAGLADTVAYVFQDSKLLKTTILENVRMAAPGASDESVMQALHDAQCDDIIAKLPQGANTVIGTKGVYLSGGECQRIAIARMMLKDAPVVVLDEASAFADPENEEKVQRAFEKLAQNKTVIMIAHRLTTVRNAGHIYVLQRGGIAEQGTHDELLAQNGPYKNMWDDYQRSIRWKVGKAGAAL